MTVTQSELLIPRDLKIELRTSVDVGPQDANGDEQRVHSSAGTFEMSMIGVPLPTADHVRAWRAMITRMRDGESLIARVYDLNGPPGFYTGGSTLTCVGGAAEGATQMVIETAGVVVDEGTYFGVLLDTFYIITGIVGDEGQVMNPISGPGPWDDDIPWSDMADGANQLVVNFLPPLHRNVSDGSGLRIGYDMRLTGELVDFEEGDLTLEYGRWGWGNLTIRDNN